MQKGSRYYEKIANSWEVIESPAAHNDSRRMGNPFAEESGDPHLKDISDHSVPLLIATYLVRGKTQFKSFIICTSASKSYNTDVSKNLNRINLTYENLSKI